MKKNIKKISENARKDQAEKTRSTKQKKPWQNEFHDGEDNIVTDHLLTTCPKTVLNKLRRQIKENWAQVLCNDHVSRRMYGMDFTEPCPVDICLDHALDCLVWRTVLELLKQHDIHEMFDVMTMKVDDADLLVRKEGKHAIVGVALALKGDNASINIYPEIAPHFACSWNHHGPVTIHMPKTRAKKTTKKKMK